MTLRALAALALVTSISFGCSSPEDEPEPTPTSAPTTPSPSPDWELEGAELDAYRDAAAGVGVRLDPDTAVSVAKEICQDLAIPLPDGELVANARRALGSVEATATEVADLISVTNEQVCPEFEK